MPVPKRKTSKSRRDQRSACKFLRPQIFMSCPECGVPTMPHVICDTCGFYKGRKIVTTKRDRGARRAQARVTKQSTTSSASPASPE